PRICPSCQTENSAEYRYCQNCGAPLPADLQPQETPAAPPVAPAAPVMQEMPGVCAEPFQNTAQTGENAATVMDGIPTEDFYYFIGKKAPKIMPKFFKMEFSGSKVSWCWPAAVLGLLFGPLGAALWFFYRKMVKPALILLAIGALVTITTGFLTADRFAKTADAFFQIFSNPENIDLEEYLNSLENAEPPTVKEIIASRIQQVSELATGIICGLFAYYWYKKHCVNKISAFRQSGVDMRYYQMGLASIGGTSGGLLFIGIVSMIFILNLPSAVAVLYHYALLFSKGGVAR
ncbi:MAG: hypothetical protein IJT66_03225, partial [Clostridia bacterium]|nr:hypothetical protein [Clostridia bacterium]